MSRALCHSGISITTIMAVSSELYALRRKMHFYSHFSFFLSFFFTRTFQRLGGVQMPCFLKANLLIAVDVFLTDSFFFLTPLWNETLSSHFWSSWPFADRWAYFDYSQSRVPFFIPPNIPFSLNNESKNIILLKKQKTAAEMWKFALYKWLIFSPQLFSPEFRYLFSEHFQASF